MKIKQKILGIKDIVISEDLYPRTTMNWITSYKYQNAMKAGSKFPPIVVAFIDGKYELIDGRHRLQAYKNLKQTNVAVEVLPIKDRKALFIEAVKRNVTHGQSFTTQEIVNIALTLEKWNMSKKQISQIVKLPATSITPFIAKRMAYVVSNDGTSEAIALKAPLNHLSGTTQSLEFEETQDKIGVGTEQLFVINDFVLMLEQGLFNLRDKKVQAGLRKIYSLIGQFKLKR